MTNIELIEKLKADLARGFSKIQLEKCIGLPQNSLSGIISGTKEISKISVLKIEQWEQSTKPDPLSLVIPKKKKVVVRDWNENTNEVKAVTPLGSKRSNITVDTVSEPDPNDKGAYLKWLKNQK